MSLSHELLSVYDEVAKCNKCGFCQAVCPIFDITKNESSVARGHNAHIRRLIEGELELNKELKDPLFECLLCMSCVANCFPAVRTDKNVVQGRAEYIKRVGQPKILKFLFKSLLHDQEKMGKYVRLCSYGKDIVMSKLIRAFGILKWFRRDFEKIGDIIEKFPTQFFRDMMEISATPVESQTIRIGYFVGCGFNFVLPNVSKSTVMLLLHQGTELIVADNCCCGIPAYVYGDLESARAMALKNMDIFEKINADIILTECATCSSFLKSYTELFEDDSLMLERAKRFVKRIKGFSEFIYNRMPTIDPAEPKELTVTYHDPCHMCRYQDIVKEPRTVLTQIPGLRYIELPEADMCCGAAGSYNIMKYDQSMKVLNRKIENLKKTGADILTTECPSCCIQLSHGVRKAGLPIRVIHISQLLQEVYLGNNF